MRTVTPDPLSTSSNSRLLHLGQRTCISGPTVPPAEQCRFWVSSVWDEPQPCGYFNDIKRECHCTQAMFQRYLQKISGPLLDRIDIHIDVPAVNYKELRGGATTEGSTTIRERVLHAREIQLN